MTGMAVSLINTSTGGPPAGAPEAVPAQAGAPAAVPAQAGAQAAVPAQAGASAAVPAQTGSGGAVPGGLTPEGKKAALRRKIIPEQLFWLYLFGSLLGVVIEGVFCLITRGRWQTHVVSMWGPFCILYGIGAVAFYSGNKKMAGRKWLTRLVVFGFMGSGIELICGWLLQEGLGMKAWDYSREFLNFRGYISLGMTIVWGAMGLAFNVFVPSLDRLYDRFESRKWDIAARCGAVIMALDLIFTMICVTRWASRHVGLPPANRIEVSIDQKYNDSFMQHRFIEWYFIN